MLKKLTTAAITTAGLLSFVTPTFAENLCLSDTDVNGFRSLCNLSFSGNTFGNIITIIFIIATILALVYLIWGGIKWVLSGGDKTKVDDARRAIVAAIVGLIIVFLSYFILNVVVGLFIKDFSLKNITLPTINGGGTTTTATCSDYNNNQTGCAAAGCNWTPNDATVTIYDGTCY